jgi:hypothetical protein
MTLSKDTNMSPLEAAEQRIRVDIALKSSAAKRLHKSNVHKVRARRVVAATNKAMRQLSLLHPEDYKALFATAFDLLGSDDRYAVPNEDMVAPIPQVGGMSVKERGIRDIR